jgi:hypothetical protein
MAVEPHCPMCGKTNPADIEICKFCGARLVSISPTSPDTPSQSSEDDVERWIRRLRGDNPPESAAKSPNLPPAQPEPEESDQQTPEWLSRIRERNRYEQSTGEWEVNPSADRAINHEKGITQPLGNVQSQKNEPAPSDDEDWLSQLRTAGITAESSSTQPGGNESGQGSDSSLADQSEEPSDWLRGLASETPFPMDDDRARNKIDRSY